MFGCCLFIPVALFMVIGPLTAAGRGPRAFLKVIAFEAAIWAGVLALGLSQTIGTTNDWFANPLLLLVAPFALMPIIMGIVIMKAKSLEDSDRSGNCRACGYDLRASPDRCPECGTPVRNKCYDSPDMAEDENRPLNRRNFFRQGFREFLKPLSQIAGPLEEAIRQIGAMDDAPPAPGNAATPPASQANHS